MAESENGGRVFPEVPVSLLQDDGFGCLQDQGRFVREERSPGRSGIRIEWTGRVQGKADKFQVTAWLILILAGYPKLA